MAADVCERQGGLYVSSAVICICCVEVWIPFLQGDLIMS